MRKPCSFGDVNVVCADDLLGKSITAGLDVDFGCANEIFANVVDEVVAEDGDALLILIWTLSVFKTGGGELSSALTGLVGSLYLFGASWTDKLKHGELNANDTKVA